MVAALAECLRREDILKFVPTALGSLTGQRGVYPPASIPVLMRNISGF